MTRADCRVTASVAIYKARQAERLPYKKIRSPADRPIHLTLGLLVALVFLVGCEAANYAPPVAGEMTRTKQGVDQTKLEHGRMLFAHRCIECHTLPPMWKYSRDDWPKIVNDMSHRASLKPAERDAVIAYILAVRKQM
jgi:mono/diheme cytochrome c family protein